MIDLLRLICRRWRVAMRAHMAAALITAAVVTGWLLFWGHTEAMGQSVLARIVPPDLPADLVLTSPDGDRNFRSNLDLLRVYSYRRSDVTTAYGPLSLGAVTGALKDFTLPQPKDEQVWLDAELASDWKLTTGDSFQIRFRQGKQYRTVATQVAGTYAGSALLPKLLVDTVWLERLGIQLTTPEWLFYNRTSNYTNSEQWLQGWLRVLPKGVIRVGDDTILEQAQEVISGTFADGGPAVALLFVFMILGVGTFNLLRYMDARRELAILKSMGLRPKEVGLLFALENLFTATLGFGLAMLVSEVVVRWLSLPILLTAFIYGRALLWLLMAHLTAAAVPYIFARTAGVAELMLGRPVPLVRSCIRELGRRYPALEEKLAQGYYCVVLPKADGEFPGICFRKAGQSVKLGEVVAWESLAWGLFERSYVSPCDGTVVDCDLKQGLVTIKPIQA